jgi:hypothetical protein
LGGLAVPWVTGRTADGRYVFGALDSARQQQAIHHHLCQVCGRRLPRPHILLMRLADLGNQRTSEPGLDAVCSAYTQRACPMVAGRLSHYRSSPPSGGDYSVEVAQPARLGAPAEPWFAVWVETYHPVTINGTLYASYAGTSARRIRSITWRLFLP